MSGEVLLKAGWLGLYGQALKTSYLHAQLARSRSTRCVDEFSNKEPILAYVHNYT